jgi:hypothetical protein
MSGEEAWLPYREVKDLQALVRYLEMIGVSNITNLKQTHPNCSNINEGIPISKCSVRTERFGNALTCKDTEALLNSLFSLNVVSMDDQSVRQQLHTPGWNDYNIEVFCQTKDIAIGKQSQQPDTPPGYDHWMMHARYNQTDSEDGVYHHSPEFISFFQVTRNMDIRYLIGAEKGREQLLTYICETRRFPKTVPQLLGQKQFRLSCSNECENRLERVFRKKSTVELVREN